MVRTVFFSFHYDEDIWRASQVRNAWVAADSHESAGYIDGGSWEEVKREGDDAIRSWIWRQMKGCSVTAVLIGSDSYGRKWIDYEIKKSVRDGKGIVGIRVHRIKNEDGNKATKGTNPLDKWHFEDSGTQLSDYYNTYDWVLNNGRENMGKWVEEAARLADR